MSSEFSNKTAHLYDETPLDVWAMILPDNMCYNYGESGPCYDIFENVVYNRLGLFGDAKTVLDVGSGFGGPAKILKKFRPDLSITCLTNSIPQAGNLSNDFNVIVADANEFVSDRRFDIVFMNEVSCHFNDDVMKNFGCADKIILKEFVSPEYYFNEEWQMHFRTRSQLFEMFEKYGFEIESYENLFCEDEVIETAKMWLTNIAKAETHLNREFDYDFCTQIKFLKTLSHRILRDGIGVRHWGHCVISAVRSVNK